MKARFQGLRGDIIEENINKAFKPMKMIAEKIPTVAICGMGKSINNLAKEKIEKYKNFFMYYKIAFPILYLYKQIGFIFLFI